jgi:ABC-type antimicrobial peptide transport system permease subunit
LIVEVGFGVPEYRTHAARDLHRKPHYGRLASSLGRDLRGFINEQPASHLSGSLSNAFGPWRSSMVLFGFFAALAVLLSAIGIYGVVSYSVARRVHEIGVRMAMGAGQGDVLLLVMKEGLLLALAGVALGSGAAYWLTRLIANQLYGVTPTDPQTFASVALVLLAMALLACYLPARRTARLDPMAALRCE